MSMNFTTQDVRKHWTVFRPLLSIRNEHEYEQAIKRLNWLVDEVGTDEQHPMYDLLDILGTVIHAYEERYHPLPVSSGGEVLRFLMEEHGLRQVDLPEVGSQGVVSEILNGRRELNIRQIRRLAKRFNVSPVVFL